MEGQMTIFDFIPRAGFCDNETINKLVDELKQMFPEIKVESYYVWPHVPNLGKRLWAYVEHYPINKDTEPFREKWLKIGLDISINVVPNFDENDGESQSYGAYISTLWKTKGHKEV